ncbi:Undecaprenyl-phosphate galactose phosphotransferase, WbaP/exopolysaccharide biosynthesis polyprenyl glycosylphosphotransferase [Cryobacterium flavum]|uniref:Sugar transferase n=1 Tax=Cryobacterium flavum TaxID=1424659 RepID=A0A4R8V4T5_9MICO|nr:sugar transferase [Cryobacterium flavum]TFB76662.1 sugar transferase [Cryobacterium flavum]SDO27519.1 Undecaprenyl-phosphate galactose phosphotransferase, WbaP/exopolysaccharide biosynthesis polyprenyl glycosylphosphotransferase [Cryobacterium flavum]
MSNTTRTRTYTKSSRDWHAVYSARLTLSDFLVLLWVVFGVQIAWFGFDSANLKVRSSGLAVSYTSVSVILIAAWMSALSIYGTRNDRVLGTGFDEYKLIAGASIRLFGLLAIVAYLFKIDVARGYILLAFPLGIVVLIFSRWMWRQWLVAQRSRGQFTSRVILIGTQESSARIAAELRTRLGAGYLVVGACVTSGPSATYLPGGTVPIVGDIDDVHTALDSFDADTVIITSSDDISPTRTRELSWSLEPGRHHLIMVPRLIDVGGPRIHTRPVAGLPLIHVETPRYEGHTLYTKRAFDIVTSALLIVALSPALAAIALAVRFSGPGPVLFSQQRVGHNGHLFKMLKFRSMVADAEARLAALQDSPRVVGNSVMFKMQNDPRVTRVGRFLRRYSLDELPQLFNVMRGSMSLVGPRPPLETEVSEYELHVHRRFLVKPGITGLWQVSGRSNLTWDETVRLDLYYVENWSLTGDLVILWRTARAVLGRDGAF